MADQGVALSMTAAAHTGIQADGHGFRRGAVACGVDAAPATQDGGTAKALQQVAEARTRQRVITLTE